MASKVIWFVLVLSSTKNNPSMYTIPLAKLEYYIAYAAKLDSMNASIDENSKILQYNKDLK